MSVIRGIVDEYPYLAMDTEFPGVVARPVGNFKNSGEYHYQMLRQVLLIARLQALRRSLAAPPPHLGQRPSCASVCGYLLHSSDPVRMVACVQRHTLGWFLTVPSHLLQVQRGHAEAHSAGSHVHGCARQPANVRWGAQRLAVQLQVSAVTSIGHGSGACTVDHLARSSAMPCRTCSASDMPATCR